MSPEHFLLILWCNLLYTAAEFTGNPQNTVTIFSPNTEHAKIKSQYYSIEYGLAQLFHNRNKEEPDLTLYQIRF